LKPGTSARAGKVALKTDRQPTGRTFGTRLVGWLLTTRIRPGETANNSVIGRHTTVSLSSQSTVSYSARSAMNSLANFTCDPADTPST